jgi:hypothetical protein
MQTLLSVSSVQFVWNVGELEMQTEQSRPQVSYACKLTSKAIFALNRKHPVTAAEDSPQMRHLTSLTSPGFSFQVSLKKGEEKRSGKTRGLTDSHRLTHQLEENNSALRCAAFFRHLTCLVVSWCGAGELGLLGEFLFVVER